MELKKLDWQVGFTADPEKTPEEMYAAQVPGAVQQDYAKAKNLPAVEYGLNFQEYAWMEDMYWLYRAPLCFELQPGQAAYMEFKGIDYRYSIRIDGTVVADAEGMFTPVTVDVTQYAGTEHTLEVLLLPVPKDPTGSKNTRDEARRSCKPAACYGWDWHPRLVSSGIWDEAVLRIQDERNIQNAEVSYRLSDALDKATVHSCVQLSAGGTVEAELCFRGKTVAKCSCVADTQAELTLEAENPALWYPVGYGQQNMYALHIRLLDENGQILDSKTRKIGLRRSRMVMNEGSWRLPNKFPKSRSDAPATLEINGRRIFAKGSNWVNARLYPGSVTEQDYRQLLQLVRDGNMNILRIWGGGFVNHEAFFDLCDEMGIMVWQEFPLACNEYPDDDAYLKVLEREAVSIVRRLRTHPSVVLWCGGNELFNNWSRMTDQHHALRLLDRVCYTEDRFTPFIMTSPLNGMAHGPYINYDPNLKSEYISVFVDSQNTAYTEFGSPGAAAAEYIKQYMSEEDFRDCQPDNPVWKAHHAFGSGFYKDTWLRQTEADYYFGGWDGVEDLCAKTQFIQTMCYRSYFEEMRKQWPHCSMALNWCFNEPWPCFANNSLVSYPVQPKSAYYAVQAALRPQLASLRIDRHLWRNGEEFEAQVWLLSDALEALTDLTVEVSYEVDGKQPVIWGSLHLPELAAQQSRKCGSISFPLPGDNAYKFKVILKVQGHPEMDSEYTYLCRPRQVVNTKGMLNV